MYFVQKKKFFLQHMALNMGTYRQHSLPDSGKFYLEFFTFMNFCSEADIQEQFVHGHSEDSRDFYLSDGNRCGMIRSRVASLHEAMLFASQRVWRRSKLGNLCVL